MQLPSHSWSCPICASGSWEARFDAGTSSASECGVDASRVRPSSSLFGATAGQVVRCVTCGHGSLLDPPPAEVLADAYLDAADPVSIREEPGQVATADRDLDAVESVVGPGDGGRLLDIGCWTGSLVVAACERGWKAVGIEPSAWAVERAVQRGADVYLGGFDEVDVGPDPFRVIAATDVLEHLLDPAAAARRIASMLEPDGVLFCTVPDAGSRAARALGRRWWAVLPMHVQYFTRASMHRLLTDAGFDVLSTTAHPKLFSRRYYVERLAAFLPGSGGMLSRVAARLPGRDRLTSVDFGDRMAVIARRRSG